MGGRLVSSMTAIEDTQTGCPKKLTISWRILLMHIVCPPIFQVPVSQLQSGTPGDEEVL